MYKCIEDQVVLISDSCYNYLVGLDSLYNEIQFYSVKHKEKDQIRHNI